MQKIIEELYEIHLKTSDFPLGQPNKESLQEEGEAYMFLYENLSGEDKANFSKYSELSGLRHAEELKAVYEYGFKTALKLVLESVKE